MNRQEGALRRKRKRPNIYDVAKEAGASVFTVSAVLNRSSRVSAPLQRRVEAAIRKLDYRPNLLARSLAKRQTHTIGVVVPDIGNPFFPLVVRGAEDMAKNAGYSVLLCNSDDQEEKEEAYLELLLAKRVDGLLVTKIPGRTNPSLRRLLDEVRIPIVLLMRTWQGFPADMVVTDDEKAAFEAVSHLARVGHHRIATISGPLRVSNAKARWQGYRHALKENGLSYEPDLCVEGDYHIDSGYRAGLTLLPRRPDAIFVGNYLMTVGLMRAAEEIGMRCPEDFAVVSFDDYPWLGYFRPRLTAVELPKYELGAVGAQMLLERIAGKTGPPVIRKLRAQLRVRESCGFGLQQQRMQMARGVVPSSEEG